MRCVLAAVVAFAGCGQDVAPATPQTRAAPAAKPKPKPKAESISVDWARRLPEAEAALERGAAEVQIAAWGDLILIADPPVPRGPGEPRCARDCGKVIRAFDRRTGEPRWTLAIPIPARPAGVPPLSRDVAPVIFLGRERGVMSGGWWMVAFDRRGARLGRWTARPGRSRCARAPLLIDHAPRIRRDAIVWDRCGVALSDGARIPRSDVSAGSGALPIVAARVNLAPHQGEHRGRPWTYDTGDRFRVRPVCGSLTSCRVVLEREVNRWRWVTEPTAGFSIRLPADWTIVTDARLKPHWEFGQPELRLDAAKPNAVVLPASDMGGTWDPTAVSVLVYDAAKYRRPQTLEMVSGTRSIAPVVIRRRIGRVEQVRFRVQHDCIEGFCDECEHVEITAGDRVLLAAHCFPVQLMNFMYPQDKLRYSLMNPRRAAPLPAAILESLRPIDPP